MTKFALKVLASVLAVIALLLALAIVWPTNAAPLPEAGADRLITNVHVIDVETGKAGPIVDVLIRDGRITAIAADLKAAPDVPNVDGKNGYLIPGLWDMHVHAFQASPQLHLPLFVANGVTGVRDMMDCPEEADPLIACIADKRTWSRASAAGTMASPRFVEIASFYFDRPEETGKDAVARARTYHQRGLDSLKVYNRIPRDTYMALATEARSLRMPLVGHLPKAVSLSEAIDSGQRSFEHAHLLVRACSSKEPEWRAGRLKDVGPITLAELMVTTYDDSKCREILHQLRDGRSWLVPTHVTREEDARAHDRTFVEDPRLNYLDPLSRWAYNDDLGATTQQYDGQRGAAVLGEYFEAGLRLTKAAHEAGVPVLVGTDSVIGGFRYHDEMELLQRAGLSPASVIKAATLDAARYAGQADKFGSVSVGKTADLVLLRADPLRDIGNTRSIEAVFIAGRLYDREKLDELLAFTKAEAKAPSNWIKLVWAFLTSSVASEL